MTATFRAVRPAAELTACDLHPQPTADTDSGHARQIRDAARARHAGRTAAEWSLVGGLASRHEAAARSETLPDGRRDPWADRACHDVESARRGLRDGDA